VTHLSENLLAKLNEVAAEVLEHSAADAYTVDKALDANEAFRQDGTVVSPARRAIVREAAVRAGSVAGLSPNRVAGGAVELIAADDTTLRYFRIKSAVPQEDGTYRVVAGAGSTLLQMPENDGVLALWEERWILGCVWADDHTLDEFFAAEVLGPYSVTTSGPVQLELGRIYQLTGLPTPPDFESDEDDDLGDEFEGQEETGFGHEAAGGTA
jgi:hypothetical protein